MMRRGLGWLSILLLLMACGTESGKFRLEGRLRNMNQGEFYVYSPDGAVEGLDTIPVREGRFIYETELRDKGTFVIIFPNMSEQVVIGESGQKATVKGDATHMKEMTISGTDENEDMTKLRMQLNRLTPPEQDKAVETFVKEHPQALGSIYLVQRYFVADRQPNYKKAAELVGLMLKQSPENGRLISLNRQLKGLTANGDKRLPTFTVTDVKGRQVTEASLKAKVNVVSVWASWNFMSTDMQRRLMFKKEKYGEKLGIMSICIDGDVAACKRTVIERDSLKWPTVCDGRMWDTPLLAKFGIGSIPACLIIDDKGRITDRNLTPQKLEEKIDQLLKEE